MNFYIPTLQDYNYFMSYYGKGKKYENSILMNTTMDEFTKAVEKYQKIRLESKYSNFSPFEEFFSTERELIRDTLLLSKGHPIEGYPVNPCHKYQGLEQFKAEIRVREFLK